VERDVKARTKGETGAAKTLCSPFDQPELPEGQRPSKFRICLRNLAHKFSPSIDTKLQCFRCRHSLLCFRKTCKEMDLLGQELLSVHHVLIQFMKIYFWLVKTLSSALCFDLIF